MNVFNLFSDDLDRDADDPPGYAGRYRRLGPIIGGSLLGATLLELEPGNSNCPYHYEYGREEWLLCVYGTVSVGTPDGERELRPGDVIWFPEGPAGAHKITNRSDVTTRVLVWSTMGEPSAAVYPDSDKIGVWSGPRFENRDHILVRRDSAVDYWEGEL